MKVKSFVKNITLVASHAWFSKAKIAEKFPNFIEERKWDLLNRSKKYDIILHSGNDLIADLNANPHILRGVKIFFCSSSSKKQQQKKQQQKQKKIWLRYLDRQRSWGRE